MAQPLILSPQPASGIAAWQRPVPPDYRGGELIRHAERSWSSVSASLAEVRCDDHVQLDLTADCTQLSIMLEQVGGHTAMRINAVKDTGGGGRSLPMSLIPPSFSASGDARGLRYMRHLVLRFDGETLAGMQDTAIDLDAALAPRSMFSCPRLLGLARLFASECDSEDPVNLLYGDGLSVALLHGLTHLAPQAAPSHPNGGLAPWQLRRATEFLESRVAENVLLHELAAVTRLSVSYFCRAFKASTGFPPHQWQLRARIEKAKRMLLDDREPISQIALALGFADQAHMTRTFSRVTGTSPAAWQRLRRVSRHMAA